MKEVLRFKAFDGTEFSNRADCKAHERKNAHLLLINCSEVEIMAVIEGKPEAAELSEAIELVGSRIARMRLAAGQRKRGEPVRQITHQPGDEPDAEPKPEGDGDPDFSDVTSGEGAEA